MHVQPPTSDSPWTIGRLLSWTTDYLTGREVAEARLASEVLLAHATRRRRIDLYARFDDVPEEDCVRRFREWVCRAGAHEPIAYLVGEKEFFSLSFTVTPDVLIPRPETETLVQCVVEHCTERNLDRPRLLDVGTGSGCVAVTVLTHLPTATVVASDTSPSALTVACDNAKRHGVSDRFAAVEADRLDLPGEVVPEEGFDVLMSNPPYVPREEMDQLDVTVRAYEPTIALTDGADGLSFYRSMAERAPYLLSSTGVVFVEIGAGQAPSVIEAMTNRNSFSHRRTWKDQVVGTERVLMFVRVGKP